MSEATARETAERCCEAALAALERGDVDKAQRLAEKAMRLAPSDEVRKVLRVVRSKQGGTATGTAANGSGSNAAASNGAAAAAAGVRRRNVSGAGGSAPGAAPAPPPPPHTPEQAALVRRVLAAGSDYYSILEIASSATEVEVKKAYRRAALRLHPDKCSAPRSAEAFGAVSRAFACLSDSGRRAHYDRWGRDPDDAAGRVNGGGGGGGGGGMRRGAGGGGNPFGAGGEFFDAEDIFNAFFGVGRRGGGGGMGGPGFSYGFGNAGPFGGGPFGGGPFGGGPFGGGGFAGGGGGGMPPRRPRQQRHHHQQQGGAGAAAAEEPPTPPWLALLAQLAPLILLLFFTLMPSSSSSDGGSSSSSSSSYYSYADSGPPASLERSPPFTEQVSTASRGVPFFVRPPAEAFARAFPPGTRERSRVDQAVEAAFRERLRQDCYAERVSAARLERSFAAEARRRDKERKRREKAEAKRRRREASGGSGGWWFGGGGGGSREEAPQQREQEKTAKEEEEEPEPRWEPPPMPACEDLEARFGVGGRQQQQHAGGWGG